MHSVEKQNWYVVFKAAHEFGLVLNFVLTRAHGQVRSCLPSRTWDKNRRLSSVVDNADLDNANRRNLRSRDPLTPRASCGERYGKSPNSGQRRHFRLLDGTYLTVPLDLVQACEFIQVKAPQTRPGQRYIDMNQRKWITVPACEQIDKSVLSIS